MGKIVAAGGPLVSDGPPRLAAIATTSLAGRPGTCPAVTAGRGL